jgi:glycosyltransferase involved in cell wall biosynthesis/radical SAM superfamily enzyme YgiQ (UPF0313 family)
VAKRQGTRDGAASGNRGLHVLFLNTRDTLAADVSVHLMLARHLDHDAVAVYAATNVYEAPGASARAAFSAIPDLRLIPLNLGRPISGNRGLRKALALVRNGTALANLARLAWLCRREGIEVIHVTERPRDALYGLALARAAGAACVVHAHTSYYAHDASRLGNWVLRQADAVVGVSRFTAGTYTRDLGLPAERVFAVHNAVDTEQFHPQTAEARAAVRERFSIPLDAQLIGCVARLMRWKAQPDLMEAMVAVRAQHARAHVVFAGDNCDVAPDGEGSFRDYLQRRAAELGIADAVTFTDFLDYAEMPTLFGALDLLAHPGLAEPFGLVLVEAMACERAVVASGEGGVPEIIHDNAEGLLVPSRAPEAMAAAINRLLDDEDLRTCMARAGRARVEGQFTPERQAAAMTDVYRAVVARRNGEVARLSSTAGGDAPDVALSGTVPRARSPDNAQAHDDDRHFDSSTLGGGDRAAEQETRMAAQLYLINPPPLKGRTNERSQSGGLGVSRKLKPGEKSFLEVLPHDFLYQAAVAEQAGHRVQFVDLILEDIYDHAKGVTFVQQAVARGKNEDPAAPIWLGVRISIPSLHSDLRLANMLKAALPEARVYLFGNVLMTTYRHWIADAQVDYLLYGEPEAIIEDLLAADDPTTVKGVISVKDYEPIEKPGLFDMASTSLHRNWRQMRDISTLPRAAWHLLEMGRYAPKGRVSELGLALPASRGCFMPCTMCAYNLHEGRSMRFRTPEEVLDEMEYLYRTYGVRHIRFRDPNFSANKPHLRTIAEGMIARHLPIEATAELSLELLDRELLELMYRAGIRTILTGVESDDPSCMASIGQHVKINRILEGKLAICRELGIKVYTFFLIGSPEETWHSVHKTFTFARSLGTECTMTIMTPFPGTPIYWRALRENLLVRGQEMRYEDWNSYTATMRTYKMSIQDLKLARLWARLETYIPFTWKDIKNAPTKQRVRGMVRLAPRVAALGGLRAYAAWKQRQEEREDPSLRTQTTAKSSASASASGAQGTAASTTASTAASTGALATVQTGIQVSVRSRTSGQGASHTPDNAN